MTSVTNVSPPSHYVPKVVTKPVDSDGDNDGSKSTKVAATQPPKPVSETIGTKVNTTA